jgi:uncharacterized membrane protein YkvA (DUF1232 family)
MKSTPRRAAFVAATAAAAAQDGPVGFAQRVAAFPRLVRDVLLGRYDGVSRGKLLMMVAAAIYIVSPIDVLPEALLTIPGLADDAVVAGWLLASVLGGTAAYVAWQEGQISPAADGRATVPGEVLIP